MSTLLELLTEHTDLPLDDVEHLHRLAGEWQLLSDLSFADLLLWVPVGDGERVPLRGPGPADHRADRVPGRPGGAAAAGAGGGAAAGRHAREGRIFREGDPVWDGAVARAAGGDPGPPARGGPADRGGRPGHQPVATRGPSKLELNYLNAADDLCQMVSDGTFPPAGAGRGAHRAAGRRRADPARRRRQGDLRQPERAVGVPAAGLHRPPGRRGAGAADPGADPATRWRAATSPTGSRRRCAGEAPAAEGDRGARRDRAVPGAAAACPPGTPIGALVLVRDVTEVRRRDRAADHQGRHDPGDPPPGEEQPADRGGAAAAAGPAGGRRRRRGPRWRSRYAGSRRSRWCTRRCRCRSTRGSTSTGSWTGCSDSLSDVAGAGTRVRLARTGSFGDPARGDRHAAGDGAHRAGAERGRARVPRGHRQRDGHGDRVPAGPADVGRRGGRRDRACRTGSPSTPATGSACRSSARWSPPSWAAPSRSVRRARSRGAEAVLDVPLTRRR